MPGIGKRAETETNTNTDQTAEIAQDALMDELSSEEEFSPERSAQLFMLEMKTNQLTDRITNAPETALEKIFTSSKNIVVLRTAAILSGVSTAASAFMKFASATNMVDGDIQGPAENFWSKALVISVLTGLATWIASEVTRSDTQKTEAKMSRNA